MSKFHTHKESFFENGFAVINDIYFAEEIGKINDTISNADTSKETFRKFEDLFAIRQFLKGIPDVAEIIFNNKLKIIIKKIFSDDYFVTKSIYFDKPGNSNWYVAYHQDITISVDKKVNINGFESWTVKQNQFAVQPPLEFLQDNFTVRIHLDDTDELNGALKVIPKTHNKGIFKPETIGLEKDSEEICNVKQGGIMLMHPLLMHASGRTVSNQKRRVIHIEFSNKVLPENLNWSEKMLLN
jgi:ectoine hydroxylase-related dioxygenase (phytanoyl-CoA dioxygenase family)